MGCLGVFAVLSSYYYCIFVAVVISLILYCYYTKYEFVAQIYSKWRLESSITNITSNDEIKSMLPSTMYILDSIERLGKVGSLLSMFIVVVSFAIYASLKYGASSQIPTRRGKHFAGLILRVVLSRLS